MIRRDDLSLRSAAPLCGIDRLFCKPCFFAHRPSCPKPHRRPGPPQTEGRRKPRAAANRRPPKKRFCSFNVPVRASSAFLRRVRSGSGLGIPLRKGKGRAAAPFFAFSGFRRTILRRGGRNGPAPRQRHFLRTKISSAARRFASLPSRISATSSRQPIFSSRSKAAGESASQATGAAAASRMARAKPCSSRGVWRAAPLPPGAHAAEPPHQGVACAPGVAAAPLAGDFVAVDRLAGRGRSGRMAMIAAGPAVGVAAGGVRAPAVAEGVAGDERRKRNRKDGCAASKTVPQRPAPR